MSRRCAVTGCPNSLGDCHNRWRRNAFDQNGLPINYFSFPHPVRHAKRYLRFLTLCNIELDENNSKHSNYVICSDHFKPDDILGNRQLRAHLKPLAEPCLNLPQRFNSGSASDTCQEVGKSVMQYDNVQCSITEDCIVDYAAADVSCVDDGYASFNVSVSETNSKANQDMMDYAIIANENNADNFTYCMTVPTDSMASNPTLKEIAVSTVLPDSNWFLKLRDQKLAFFDVMVDADSRPRICHSVTFCENDLSNPIIYVRDSMMRVPKTWHFSSIDDVSALLRSVSCSEFQASLGFHCILDKLDELICNVKQDDISQEDTAEANVNQPVNDYSDALRPDVTGIQQKKSVNDSACPSLLFIRHQLQLSAFSSAKNRRYDPAFIRWCLLIYFHSPAAYRAMLQSQFLLLPSERLLRMYTSTLNVRSGVSLEREIYLSDVVTSLTDLQKHVSLIVDEMYIKPEISYCAGNLYGFADNSEDAVAASTMLTIMAQSLCGTFRDVVAFIPVTKLTGDNETSYMTEAIKLLERVGFFVECVICDNSKVNRVMMHNFGVIADGESIVANPVHPVDATRKLIFIIDPCHLLKCIRNNWINRKTFCIDGREVSFHNITHLYNEDQRRAVKLVPKLTVKVVNPTNTERQCVRLAAALFSPEVMSGLEMYMLSDPLQFSEANACVDFVRKIHQFWSWSNIQHVYQGRNNRDPNQQPFGQVTDWRLQEMEEMKSWLRSWNSDAKSGLTRETFTAFLLTLTSMKLLVERLLNELGASFVLTGRFQQDPLEERFAAHRQRAGCSYNPSALQFQQSEKRLSVLKYVLQTNNCNTTRLERKAGGLSWDSSSLPRQPKKLRTAEKHDETDDKCCTDDVSFCASETDGFDDASFCTSDSDGYDIEIDRTLDLTCETVPDVKTLSTKFSDDRLSEIAEGIPEFTGLENMELHEQQALVYISGYVAKKLSEKISCQNCVADLHTGKIITDKINCSVYQYLSSVSRGGLFVPSEQLLTIVAKCQHVFSYLVGVNTFLKEMSQRDVMHMLLIRYVQTDQLHFCCKNPAHIDANLQIIARIFCNLSLNRYSKERTLAVAPKKTRKLTILAESNGAS